MSLAEFRARACLIAVSLAISATMVAGDAFAQSAIPGTTSDVQNQVKQAGQRSETDTQVPSLDTEDQPDATAAGSSTVTFQLNGIEFPDYPPREFSEERGNFSKIFEIYEGFIGTEVTIGGLREIANRIERLYRDEGYLATRVIIPPQTIEGGIAQLEVHEGRIIHYEVNGDIGPVKKQIAALLDNLLTDRAARQSDVERYLLLSRDLPGISLTGTLRSAGDNLPGGVILVVDTARKAVDGFVQLQNKNAEATGTFTLSTGPREL